MKCRAYLRLLDSDRVSKFLMSGQSCCFQNFPNHLFPFCGMTAATACNGAQISGSSSLAHQQSHQIHSKRFDATFAKTIFSLKLFSIYKRADKSILEKPKPKMMVMDKA